MAVDRTRAGRQGHGAAGRQGHGDAVRQGGGGAVRQGGGGGRPGDGADLVAGDGFLFQQGGGEPVEGVAVGGEQVPGAGFGVGQEGGDFLVDEPLGVLGVAARAGQRGVAGGRGAVADRADRLAEAVLADHLGGQGGRGGQVVGGAGGGLAADQAFGGPAAEADREGVGQVPFAVQPAVVGGQRLGQPEGLPGAQHGDPADRVGVRGQGGDQGVAGLVDGDGGELAGGQRAGVPGAEQHPVAGGGEVGGGQGGAAGPDRGDGGLVEQAGQVRAGESGGGGGDLIEVGVGAEVLAAGVGGQDGGPFGPAGQRDEDLAVEPAGPAQRGVQGVRPVGGGQHHHPAGVLEPVHLGEQLVQGLLPLVAAAEAAGIAAGAERVDLIDEHDRRAAGAGLLEQVPDPGRPDAGEDLHETRARYREERDVGLAGDRAGQQGLAGAGRPGHQHPARAARAGPVPAARIAQVVHDLADLGLDRGIPGHVGEPGGRPLGVDDPRPGLGQAGQVAQAAALPAGAADNEIEQAAEQQQRQQPGQHRQQRGGRGGGGGGDLDVVSGQVTGQAVAAERDRDGGGERVPAGQAAGDLARRADRHRADRPGADIGYELGIGQRRAGGCAARQGQQHQEADYGRGEQPPLPRGCVGLAGRAGLGHAHLNAPSAARRHAGRGLTGLAGVWPGSGGQGVITGAGCTRAHAARPARAPRPRSRRGSAPARRRPRRAGRAG